VPQNRKALRHFYAEFCLANHILVPITFRIR
jgi:hypothetical protein